MDMLSPGDVSAPGSLLIVDDDAINRAILENLFAPFYPIEEAEDGDEGLARILARPERFCAVLLDVVMPRMSGLEVLETPQGERPDGKAARLPHHRRSQR